jgi:UDP-glucuronate 4-epimerase
VSFENGPVLVTGAAGFIGSSVASKLAIMGVSVVGCDNFNNYYSTKLKFDRVDALLKPVKVPCLSVELADSTQVEKLFRDIKPSMVIHLAAQAGVRYSIENPSAYLLSNIVGFGNILEACKTHAVSNLFYASSSSVYGNSTKVPFREDDCTDNPVSVYAASKKSNELMAYAYSELFGIRTIGLRFFTVYGPWGRPDMAYFSFTEKMLRGEEITVYAEGKLQRDFTYIDDIVEGVTRLFLKTATIVADKLPAAVFNVGNCKPVSVLTFVETLQEVLHVKANIKYLSMQLGDVEITYADTSKLKKYVNYSPNTELKDGLSTFSEWYKGWV